MKDIAQYLVMEPVHRSEHLLFNWHEFSFFKNSERGSAFLFGGSTFLAPLLAVPYVLAAELIFFRKTRYFVKLKENTVAVLVLREKLDDMYISSLGVAPHYRRHGIATFILTQAEELAKRLGKKNLELSVSKTNAPAQKAYKRFGFTAKGRRRWSLILRKRLRYS